MRVGKQTCRPHQQAHDRSITGECMPTYLLIQKKTPEASEVGSQISQFASEAVSETLQLCSQLCSQLCELLGSCSCCAVSLLLSLFVRLKAAFDVCWTANVNCSTISGSEPYTKLVRLGHPNTMQDIHALCNVYVQNKGAGQHANRKRWQQDLLPQSIIYMSGHSRVEALNRRTAVFGC